MQTRSGFWYEARVGLSRSARLSPRRVAARSPAMWMWVFSRLTHISGPGFWFLPAGEATPSKADKVATTPSPQQLIAYTLRSVGDCVSPSFIDSVAPRAMPFGTSMRMEETSQTTTVNECEPTIRIQWNCNNSTKRLERMQIKSECKTLSGRRLDVDALADQVDPSKAAFAAS
jgi:hypothetical protein